MVIALDMDGTLADLYGVPGWLASIRGEDPSPYERAKPMFSARDMAEAVKDAELVGIHVEVITWGPGGNVSQEYQEAVRHAKRAWLDREGMADVPMRYKAFKTPKRDGVAGRAILIDDDEEARKSWESSGDGPAIEPGNVVEQIGKIVNRYLASGK